MLKYWSHKHLDTFLFLLSCFQSLTGHSPDFFTDTDWYALSQLLPHTKPESLKYKWACLQTIPSKVSHNWTLQEDQLLRDLISEMSPELLHQFELNDESFNSHINSPKVKWSFIAMELNQRAHKNDPFGNYFPKLGKHCRERWFNHLTPHLKKTEWTDADDLELMELAIKYDRKWAKIAQRFPGRTQHNVKNRYLSLIAREYKISRKKLSAKLFSCKFLLQNTLCNLRKRLGDNNNGSRNNNKNWFFGLEPENGFQEEKDEARSSTMNEALEKHSLASDVFSEQEFNFEQDKDRMDLLFENQITMMNNGDEMKQEPFMNENEENDENNEFFR